MVNVEEYSDEELNAYHEGRHACRKKYEKSGLLVLNPEIDWEKELASPCDGCEYKTLQLKIGCWRGRRKCDKFQKFLTAEEIYEHFKK